MQCCSLQHRTLLPSPNASTTGHCFCCGPASSFCLELSSSLHHSSTWDTYWPGGGGTPQVSVSYLFAFSYCLWGSQGKNTGVVCHSFLQWATFCQKSLAPWPIHPGWPHTAGLTASLSYTILWFVWSFWLVIVGFCSGSCGIVVLASSVCPLMDSSLPINNL